MDIKEAKHFFKSKKPMQLWILILLIFSSLLLSCQKQIQTNNMLWDSHSDDAKRRRLVSDAHQLKNFHHYQFEHTHFSFDCSGYIASILHKNGLLTKNFAKEQRVSGNGVNILYQFIEKNGQVFQKNQFPKAGDLVFFSNTYDRNRDGQLNDFLTHVGIVESINNDGQISFLHHTAGKVKRSYLNMGFENQHLDADKTILNSHLRRKMSKDPKNTKYLASQLIEAYGSLILK